MKHTPKYNPKTFLIQSSLNRLGGEVKLTEDGIWGVKTETAYQMWLEKTQQGSLTWEFPQEEKKALNSYFGVPDFRNGLAPNLVFLQLPFPMFLAWNTNIRITKISCNNKVRDSLSTILNEIFDFYEEDGIQEHKLNMYGGCVNVRPKRRGGKTWSTHSWGIAIDINPTKNGLHTPWEDGKQGTRGYATMPTKVVEIFEQNGWLSGGRAWGRDAMHFQATQ